jgi:hypothetical protein
MHCTKLNLKKPEKAKMFPEKKAPYQYKLLFYSYLILFLYHSHTFQKLN